MANKPYAYNNALSDEDLLDMDYETYSDNYDGDEPGESVEEGSSGNKTLFLTSITNFIKKRKYTIFALLVGIFYLLTAVRALLNLIEFAKGVSYLDSSFVRHTFSYYLRWGVGPFLVWIASTHTKIKYWKFERSKIGSLIFCFINLSVLSMQVLFAVCCGIFLPITLLIPPSEFITPGMTSTLLKVLVSCIPFIFAVLVAHFFILLIYRPEVLAIIMHFKFNRNLDLRGTSVRFAYDARICRHAKTGKIYAIKEAMRKYHMAIVGATGSGKTSTGFLPAIANDLDQLIFNINYQKKKVLKWLKKGKVRLDAPMSDDEFSLSHFSGVNLIYERKLKSLAKKATRCGITVIAPNAGFADDVYELLKNRGLTNINRIDPEHDENGNLKTGYRGLNPLFVKNDLPHDKRMLEIIHKSRTFSDVMQALFEEGGSKNIYFSSLNRQFTSAVCTILIVTMPRLHRKEPTKYPRDFVTPEDFYNVMNDFSRIQDFCDEMKVYLDDYPEDNRYYRNILILIQRDMLGSGRDALQEQARGLVIQISDLLANPTVRNLLCCEDSVDFDEALSESQITLVNYSLALGDSDSRALGLFVFLLLQGAMFRRPVKNRPIHLVFIDEFPVLLHPKFSKAFSIYRQYNGCLHVALQSLSQFKERSETAFMKDVLLSNASTQIIFGRGGTEEMETYEKLGGKVDRLVVQQNISESSLSLENPSLSYGERSGIQKESYITGRDIYNKDFLEATVKTLDEGNPVDMFSAVFDFLTPKQKTGKKLFRVDWSDYCEHSGLDNAGIDDDAKAVDIANFLKSSAEVSAFGTDNCDDAPVSSRAEVDTTGGNAGDTGIPIGADTSTDTESDIEKDKPNAPTGTAFGLEDLDKFMKGLID